MKNISERPSRGILLRFFPVENRFLPFLVVLIMTLVNMIWLTSYPMVAMDEGSETSRAFGLFDSSKNILRTGADITDRFNSGMLIMPVLLRISFALADISVFSARLVPVLLGALLLLLTFFLTKYLYATKTAYLSILFLGFSETFFYSSHLVRSDMALAVMVLLSFLFLMKGIQEGKNRFYFLSGITIGFGFEAHPNALLFALAMTALILLNRRFVFWKDPGLLFFIAGGACYILFYFWVWFLPMLDDWFEIIKHANTQDHPIPIFFYSFIEAIIKEFHRYKDYLFHKYLIVAALVFSIGFLLFKKEKKDLLIILFLVLLFISFALFSSNKDVVYLISIYPFFCILMGKTYGSLQAKHQSNIRSWSLKFAVILLILANTLTLYHRVMKYKSHNYDLVIAEIKTIIPQRSKILALPSYWIGLNRYPFLSAYALTYYNLIYDSGIREAMEKIKPDIIIVDSYQRALLTDNNYYGETHIGGGTMFNLPRAEFNDFLTTKTQLLKTIPNEIYGDIYVYKAEW